MNPMAAVLISILWVFESISMPLQGIYTGDRLLSANLKTLVSQVKPGMVVVIGEKHNNKLAQHGQLEVLKEIRAQGHTVSVGMEFISYPSQSVLAGYRAGTVSEDEFLRQAWRNTQFDEYRDQILFPHPRDGGQTVALNAPSYLTTKIRQTGFASLTASEAALLPPDYQVGNSDYRARFAEAAGHHLTPATMEGYFNAQSVWDDTMAWRTAEFLRQNPTHVFVIIVGSFHVDYGGGLPDRLKARGVTSILTLGQVDHSDYSDEQLKKELLPHPEYGPRADYLWIF